MSGKKKIVIFEDEKDLRILMKEILEEAQAVEVLASPDAEQAVRICQEARPDLIFLDYVLPKIKGNKVLALLREQEDLKDIPVVFMSGLPEKMFIKEKILKSFSSDTPVSPKEWPQDKKGPWGSKEKRGAVIFLPKPFSKETLLELSMILLKES